MPSQQGHRLQSHPLPIESPASRNESFLSNYGSLGRPGLVLGTSWSAAVEEALNEASLSLAAAVLPEEEPLPSRVDHALVHKRKQRYFALGAQPLPPLSPPALRPAQATVAPPLEAALSFTGLASPRLSLSSHQGAQWPAVEEDKREEERGADEKLSGWAPYRHELGRRAAAGAGSCTTCHCYCSLPAGMPTQTSVHFF